MVDFIKALRTDELVNLDAIEAIFIKNPPTVDMSKLGNTKEEIDRSVAKLARKFKVIARGYSGTYILFEGTLEQCKDYVDTLFKDEDNG